MSSVILQNKEFAIKLRKMVEKNIIERKDYFSVLCIVKKTENG